MLMLLDSAGLYFRAFHGVPSSVRAPDGTPINAVRGFLDMCAALITSRRPTGLVACWDDDWRPAWRVELLASYKAHRVADNGGEDAPDELAGQVPIIADVLAALGIPRVGAPGFEADDVIATLARRHAPRAGGVEVVTGDRDLLQLIDDSARIVVVWTGRGMRRLEILDEAAVRAAHGVAPDRYVEYATLRGDPSDGLPGVPGVGSKTAAALLTEFTDLAAVRRAAREGTAGMRPAVAAALIASEEYLDRALPVVRVADDVPLPPVVTDLPRTPADPVALAVLARRWGLTNSVARLTKALAG